MLMVMLVVLGILIVVAVLLVMSIKKVPEKKIGLVERLGAYHTQLPEGTHFIIPIIDKVAYVIDVERQFLTIPDIEVELADNSTLYVSVNVEYQIVDVKKSAYNVQNVSEGITSLTQLLLKDSYKKIQPTEASVKQREFSEQTQHRLKEETKKFGISILKFELLT